MFGIVICEPFRCQHQLTKTRVLFVFYLHTLMLVLVFLSVLFL